MSLTYGFYNSLNHDRRYSAIQMSSIFDGVINDGIFMSIGDRFAVTAAGTDMFVTVGTGRAWFDHTWTLNDAALPIEIPQAELVLNRYDAVVLEVNGTQAVRANDIKVVKGTPSSNPTYPKMTNTELVHQYPLAYIYVAAGVTSIRQANVTSMIGKDDAPYVTGIIDTIDIEDMVAQWEDEWKKFFEEETDEWRTWFESYVSEMNESAERWNDLWHEWYHMYTNSSTEEFGNWKNEQKAEFLEWFNGLKDILTDQVEAMMAAEIEELKKRADALEKFKKDLTDEQTIYESVEDFEEDVITDATGDPIDGREILAKLSDICNHPIIFESGDSMVPKQYDSVPLVESGIPLGTLMNCLSRTVKNVRYLSKRVFDDYWKMLNFFNVPVEVRRNTFRGKNLGAVFTEEQKAAIRDGSFRGFYVGDYWTDGNITWRIVDINYWLGTGDTECVTPHLVIMPDDSLYTRNMNSTNVTTGAYVGSEMYKTGLNQAKETVNKFFGTNNVLSHREYLQNATTSGYASGANWYASTVELPNEIMMYGSYIFTPAGNGTVLVNRYTVNKTQLSLMQIHPKWICPKRRNNWLRDVVSGVQFGITVASGDAGTNGAINICGVRPVFGITG